MRNNFLLILVLLAAGVVLSLHTLESKAASTVPPVINVQIDPDPLVLNVPEVFDYPTLDEWNSIQDKIVNTTAKDVFLNIAGFGGYTNIGNKFIRALQMSQAEGKKITMNIIGASYSFHAFITCYADKVNLLPGAALMFHQAYSVTTHLFGMITFRDTNLDPATEALQVTMLQQCVAKNILTKEDVAAINSGHDVTLANIDNKIVKVVSADALSIYSTVSDIALVVLYMSLFIVLIGLIKRV